MMYEDTLSKLCIEDKTGTKIRAKVNGKEKTYYLCGIIKNGRRQYSPGQNEMEYPEVFSYKKNLESPCFAMGTIGENEKTSEERNAWLNARNINYDDICAAQLTMASFVKAKQANSSDIKQSEKDYRYDDFETVILFPLFALILMIISFIAIIHASTAVIDNRKKSLTVYRMMGMTSHACRRLVIKELLVLFVAAYGMGLIIGMLFYEGLFLLFRQCLGVDMENAFLADHIIRSISLDPFLTTGLYFLGCFLILVVWLWLDQWEMLPEKTMVSSKSDDILKKVLGLRGGSHAMNVAVMMLILVMVYAGSCILQTKFSMVTSDYYEEDGVSQDSEKDYDFIAKKNFQNDMFGFYCINKRVSGISEKEKISLDGIAASSSKKCIEIPSVRLHGKNIIKKNTNSFYKKRAENVMFLEFVDQLNVLNGYGKEECKEMYNVPMTAMDKADFSLKEIDAKLLEGEIDEDAVSKGKEIILVIPKNTSTTYHAGDELKLSDVLIDPDSEAYDYDFSDGSICEDGTNFSYMMRNAKGEAIQTIDNGYAYGKRHDFSAKIGAIVQAKTEDNFYYVSNLLGGDFVGEILTFSTALSQFGLPDQRYTKAAYKINSVLYIKRFEKKWNQLYQKKDDMNFYNLTRTRQKILAEKIKYIFMLVLLVLFLLLLGFVAAYYCMKIQVIQKKKEIAILRSLGIAKERFIHFYRKRYMAYTAIAVSLQWLPLFLNQLHRQYIVHTSLKLVEKYYHGNANDYFQSMQSTMDAASGEPQSFYVDLNLFDPEYIKKYAIVIKDVPYDNWFYYLDGGIYDISAKFAVILYVLLAVAAFLIIWYFVKRVCGRLIRDSLEDDFKRKE